MLKDGESMQDHVKTMTELFNELAIVGGAIEDEDQVVYLLASLPDSFNTLVTALEASEAVPQMEVVIERLLHTERKQKEKSSSDPSAEKAMTTKRQFKGHTVRGTATSRKLLRSHQGRRNEGQAGNRKGQEIQVQQSRAGSVPCSWSTGLHG